MTNISTYANESDKHLDSLEKMIYSAKEKKMQNLVLKRIITDI